MMAFYCLKLWAERRSMSCRMKQLIYGLPKSRTVSPQQEDDRRKWKLPGANLNAAQASHFRQAKSPVYPLCLHPFYTLKSMGL